MAIQTLGYYSLLENLTKDSYIGAMLVIDKVGKPMEFRTTYPIKPTFVQKQLYGDSLLPYINQELCGQPLYQALTHKPDILVVEKLELLILTEVIKNCHLAQIMPFNRTLDILQKVEQRQQLTSPGNQFESLAVAFPKQYNNSEQTMILNQLTDFFKTVNLREPFQRIIVALKALADQDPHFR